MYKRANTIHSSLLCIMVVVHELYTKILSVCLPPVRSTLRGGVQSEGVHVPRPAHHAHALRQRD